MDPGFDDKEHPEFWKSINRILPELCELSRRLLRCLAAALGTEKVITKNISFFLRLRVLSDVPPPICTICLNPGLEEDYFVHRHKYMCTSTDNNPTTFRTLFYPSLSSADTQEPGVQRCGEHSDYGTITLLLQDSIGGLEVLSEGQWIPATPIPDTVLVNLGDLMQFWTADHYKATVSSYDMAPITFTMLISLFIKMHRVQIPKEETRQRCSRQSLAFFVHPDNEVMVSPLDGSTKYPTISALDHLNQRYSQTYTY